MFFTHAIGGTVGFMTPVAQRMASKRDVYGLQCHGLDPRNTPDTTIEDMAARYRRAIRLVQPSGPYELVGYSMGGLIAAEIARAMVADGETVSLAAAVDTVAPTIGLPETSPAEALHLISLALGIHPHFHGDATRGKEQLIHDFLAHCAQARCDQTGTALTGLRLADIAQLLELYQVNGSAANRYAPRVINAPVSCLVTKGGEPSRSLSRWRALVPGRIQVECVDADHFQLMHEAHADRVAEVLNRWIGEASAWNGR